VCEGRQPLRNLIGIQTIERNGVRERVDDNKNCVRGGGGAGEKVAQKWGNLESKERLARLISSESIKKNSRESCENGKQGISLPETKPDRLPGNTSAMAGLFSETGLRGEKGEDFCKKGKDWGLRADGL